MFKFNLQISPMDPITSQTPNSASTSKFKLSIQLIHELVCWRNLGASCLAPPIGQNSN